MRARSATAHGHVHETSDNPDIVLVVTPAQFQKHLGPHLLEIALFSVPRDRGGDMEGDSPKVQLASRELQPISIASVENEPIELYQGNQSAQKPNRMRLYNMVCASIQRHK